MFDFNQSWNWWTQFSKKPPTQNFTDIRPAEAELFHDDRRTDGWIDMMKLKPVYAFGSCLANTPKTLHSPQLCICFTFEFLYIIYMDGWGQMLTFRCLVSYTDLILYAFLFTSAPAARPALIMLLVLLTTPVFNSLLVLTLLDPNTPLSNLFSKTLTQYFSL